MRATLLHGAGDIRVEDVPDPKILTPTDAIVRITRACICGSDLWPYQKGNEEPSRIGHEFIGVVEETGAEVDGLSVGDVVVSPFKYSDNTCDFCAQGLHTSCRNGGFWGAEDAAGLVDGAQGQYVRVPQAAGTLVTLPVDVDDELMPALLTLSDVFPTGHHSAVMAGVGKGDTVSVIGDGAVGLSAVLAASRLGAERIILLGRHTERTEIGRAFGATDVVAARGDEAIAGVRELAADGTHKVLECVGTLPALETAFGVVRHGGTISRVGAPQYEQAPAGPTMFRANVTLTSGIAPSARNYIEELLPDVLDGKVQPGKVFDRTIGLDEVSDGYRAMHAREALKVLIRP